MTTKQQGDNIMNQYFTWNTKKNADSTYSYIVKKVVGTKDLQENGNYAITTIEKTGTCKTRAMAKGKAIKWVQYFKATTK